MDRNEQTGTSSPVKTESPPRPTHYVGIGASAGGLEAIESFFSNMPAQTGLSFIVIQHLSPDYKSLMVELLSKKTSIPVLQAVNGQQVEPDHIYLIPPKQNLTIFHGKLILREQNSGSGINLPIDIFFRSLAEEAADRAVGIVLSGTGSDGTRGVRAIKEYNGMVMVQEEESAKFDGMPRAALSTGVADFVMPPEEMPPQLLAFVKHPYETKQKALDTAMEGKDSLSRIFAELRDKTKVDFTYYKPSTILRRLERRMAVNDTADIDEYLKYLYANPGETITLYRELLIGVTSFFRDPESMRTLQEEYLPELISNSPNRELRFWVAGCSTGEEAYSLAMLTKEVMEQQDISRDIKIFATDIDRNAIIAAGSGFYPESIAADLSPKFLGKYFYKKEENYQIVRNIREMVVFAHHNLIKDPPFTNIDLVSCRNMLIYLQPVLQQKAMEMFNFSLNAGGLLFLGSSETVGEMADHFEPVDHKHKIYRSRGKDGKRAANLGEYPQKRAGQPPLPSFQTISRSKEERTLLGRYIDALAEEWLPLSVIVNEQLEVLHTIGNPDGYFRIPTGKPNFEIAKIAAKDLAIPLATGIQKVFRTRETMTYTNIRLRDKDSQKSVRMTIIPLPERKGQEALATVLLSESDQPPPSENESDGNSFDIGKDAEERIKDLELELQFTKENLQATIEELETANEELQATNEELLASNEELQSTNEELQSTNEELYTVNAEYQKKINELTELNNDVENLLTSSRIGKLLLDENLEIRKYSPEITRIFSIMEQDVGRPLAHISNRFVDFDPIPAVETVIRTNRIYESDVTLKDGTTYLLRILPYNIGPNIFSGVVVTFIDITKIKETEEELSNALKKSADIIRHMPAGLFVYKLNESEELILESANPQAETITGIGNKDRDKSFDSLWPEAAAAGLTAALNQVLRSGTPLSREIVYRDERLNGAYQIQAFKLPESRLAVSFKDISKEKEAREEIIRREKQYRFLFEKMTQGVVYQDENGAILAANPAAQKILGLSLDEMQGRTSRDPRWKATRRDGSSLPGEEHPAMQTLATGKPVMDYVMGVYNPLLEQQRWIAVNAFPIFDGNSEKPHQVFTTFDDITGQQV